MLVSIDGIDYKFSSRLPRDAEKSAQFLLLRLLLGACSVGKHGRFFPQSLDFSRFPSITQSSTGAVAVQAFVSSNIGGSVGDFVKMTIADNRRFFFDLLGEMANYFHCFQTSATPSGFVYLYRALERLSFSAPLLYCSTSKDFEGTFKDLKLFFSEADGDLGLLRKFIEQGKLIDPLVLATRQTIDFSSSASNGMRFFNLVNSRYSAFYSTDPSRQQLEVEFRAIQGLFVTIRNRFFHLRTGDSKNNIGIKDVHDAEEFFSIVCPIFCDFLANLILAIVAAKYKS